MFFVVANNAMRTIMNAGFVLRMFCVIVFTILFSMSTYHAHRALSSEYHRSCNANMFVAMFIKNSRYCEIMHWIILLLETKFAEVARMAVTSAFA